MEIQEQRSTRERNDQGQPHTILHRENQKKRKGLLLHKIGSRAIKVVSRALIMLLGFILIIRCL